MIRTNKMHKIRVVKNTSPLPCINWQGDLVDLILKKGIYYAKITNARQVDCYDTPLECCDLVLANTEVIIDVPYSAFEFVEEDW